MSRQFVAGAVARRLLAADYFHELSDIADITRPNAQINKVTSQLIHDTARISLHLGAALHAPVAPVICWYFGLDPEYLP